MMQNIWNKWKLRAEKKKNITSTDTVCTCLSFLNLHSRQRKMFIHVPVGRVMLLVM